jgi:hypothetical protein
MSVALHAATRARRPLALTAAGLPILIGAILRCYFTFEFLLTFYFLRTLCVTSLFIF